MHLVYFSLGILLYFAMVIDVLKTALSSNGGGPITNFVSRCVWEIFFLLSGRNGESNLLRYAGPGTLFSVLLTWILSLWLGLFLMLISDPYSIVNSSSLEPASDLQKFYFAGFTLSTLGVGDFIAATDFWRIITVIASFSGLVFITISITYFVPVLSAANLQSQLSLYINGMGRSPQQMLTNSWDGETFTAFFDNTSDLCRLIMQHLLNHHSYPVIHYFHNTRKEFSVTTGLIVLEETYQLIKYAVADEVKKEELQMSLLRSTLDAYYDMVMGNFIHKVKEDASLPFPNLKQMRDSGIPLREEEAIRHDYENKIKDRRKLLTTLLVKDGWTWKNIYRSS